MKVAQKIQFSLLAVVLLLWNPATAQVRDFAFQPMPSQRDMITIDNKARTIHYMGDALELAKSLSACSDNVFLKYRAIYAWIGLNVSLAVGETRSPSIPDEILDKKTAGNKAYAYLFCYLCQLAGLGCEVVSGWAKTTPADLYEIDYSQANHAWNAFMVNDRWWFCDVAWGAGYSLAYQNKFIADYSGVWFGLPAGRIMPGHYPEDPAWLNGELFTKEGFDEQPVYYRTYYSMAVQGLSPNTKHLKKGINGKVKISFETAYAIHSINVSQREQKIPFEKNGNRYTISFYPNKSGTVSTIYVNNKSVVAYISQ